MQPLEELELLLRPACGGIYLVSSGREDQQEVQRFIYGTDAEAEVQACFRESLGRIATARAVMLAIPSDVGAGYLRGASLGPQSLRMELHEQTPDWHEVVRPAGLVDIGDVFVVPQLLHDDMLSEAQKAATRRAIYPEVPRAEAERLPVSPLSIAERALDLVFQINPRVAPVVLGGDHSTAWPVVTALSRARRDQWAIVQPDAHTDLLPERLGVKYCFATWSYHANELLGRGGRLVQVGTRASRHDRGHWEGQLGVRQLWAEECRARPAAVLDEIVAHLRGIGATGVYLSNDIDGTDEHWAEATGTPEPGGLEPDFVVELIRRLGRDVGLIGGDIMEVAPRAADLGESYRTVKTAVRYLRETLGAILGTPV